MVEKAGVWSSQYQFHEEKETLTHHEDASGTELIGVINNIQEVNDEIDMTSLTLSANTLWEHQEKAVNLGDAAIAFINSLKLLPLCDHILQATDAGPRVGAFKTLRCQGFNTWTHMNRPSEGTTRFRTKRSGAFQAAIGQALVDGRALHWEYFQPTDLISEEELGESTHSWRNERAKKQK